MKNKNYNLFFTLLFPVIGLVSYIRSNRKDIFHYPLLVFFIFFGLLFVVPESGDAARHFEKFQLFQSFTWSQFNEELIDTLFLRSLYYTDIYVLFTNYFLSRIADSSSIYFGFHAIVYGIIFLKLFSLILENVYTKVDVTHQIIFIALFLVLSIAKIQYVRFWLSSLFFLYGSYSFILKGYSRYWVYFILAILVHIGLALPSFLFVLYAMLRGRLFFWFIVALTSYFANTYLSTYSGSIVDVSSEYLDGSAVEYKTSTYVGREDYIEERASRFDDLNFYARYNIYMNHALSIVSVFLFIFLKRKGSKIPEKIRVIYTFSLFLYTLSQFGSVFASVGERISILFIFSNLYCCLLIYKFLSVRWQRLLFLPVLPIMCLFILMSVREIIGVASIFTIIGTPIVIPFAVQEPISIYELIFK